jgi:hypothetical protein
MSALTNHGENGVVNALLRGASLPSTWYIALATAVADAEAGTFTECAGTGYARESIAVGTGTWDAASSGRGDNTGVIDFGTAGAGDWGTLTHAVFMDAASSGNAWIVVALTTPKAINNGDPVTFPAGSLGVTGA